MSGTKEQTILGIDERKISLHERYGSMFGAPLTGSGTIHADIGSRRSSLTISVDNDGPKSPILLSSNDSFEFRPIHEIRSKKKYKMKNRRHKNWLRRHAVRLAAMAPSDRLIVILAHKKLCEQKVVPETDVFQLAQDLVDKECNDKPEQYLGHYKSYIVPEWDHDNNCFYDAWLPSTSPNEEVENQSWSFEKLTRRSTYDYIDDSYTEYIEEDHRLYLDRKEAKGSKLRQIQDIYGEWDDTIENQSGFEILRNILSHEVSLVCKDPVFQNTALKYAEGILTMYYSLAEASSIKHLFAILASYISLMTTESMVLTILKYFKKIFNYADGEIRNQSAEQIYEIFKNVKAFWATMQHSKLMGYVKKALAFLVSFKLLNETKLFTIDGFERVYDSYAVHTKKHTFSDVITWCLEFSSFILDKGLSLWTGKTSSIMSFFYDDARVLQFVNKMVDIENSFELIKIGQEWKAKIDVNDFRIELDETISQMSAIYNTLETQSEKTIVISKLTALKRIKNDFIIMDNNKTMRIAPYGICFWGNSSVGKSTILPVITNAICRANGICHRKESMVSINSQDKYQSEIMPQHRTIIVDDAGNTNALKAEGNHVDLAMKLINNNPIHAVKADLADKGRIVMHPDIVIYTANSQVMDVGAYSNHFFSFLRRFRCSIHVAVRPEYCREGTEMLDPDKVNGAIGDYWLFTVSEAMPQGNGGYSFRIKKHNGVTLDCISLDALLQYLACDTKHHFTHQARVVAEALNIHDVELCPHGSYSNICSQCAHVEPVYMGELINENIVNQVDTDVASEYTGDDVTLHDAASQAGTDDLREHVYDEDALQAQFYDHLYRDMLTWSWWKHYVITMIPTVTASVQPNGYYINMPYWWRIYSLHFAFQAVYWYLVLSFIFPLIPACVFVFFILTGVTAFFSATIHWAYEMSLRIRAMPLQLLLRTKSKLQQHKYKIAGVAGLVAVCYGLKKMYDAFHKIEEQGSEVSRPKPLPKEDGSVWAAPELYPVTLAEKSLTTTKEQLHSKLSSVQCHAVFRKLGKTAQACNITPISNGFWVAPWHLLSLDWEEVEVTRVFKYDSDGNPVNNSNFKSKLAMNIIKRIAETDLGIMYLPKGGSILNLAEYLPKKMDFSVNNFPMTSVHKNREGKITVDHFNGVKHHFTINEHDYQSFGYRMSRDTFTGLCGAVIQANWKHPFIAGFHTAGRNSSPEGWCCILYHDDYIAATRELEGDSCVVIQAAHLVEYDFTDTSRNLTHTRAIHEKSPSRYLEDGSIVNHLGMHNGQRRTFRSNVVPTIITGSVAEIMGVEPKHGPPAMGGWYPWQTTLQSWSTPLELDPHYLELAAKDFHQKIFTHIDSDENYKNIIHPIDDASILAGVDGVRFVDRMKLRTSMGWPYCKPKDNYITPLSHYDSHEYEGITEPLEMTEDLRQQVEEAEEKLARGERVNFIFRSNLKDEPKKLGSKKVRVFSGAPFVCTFLMRKYFTMIFKYMQEHSDLFECAVGCNANGPDWTDIANRIKKFGEQRCIAGDYKTYDLRMANQMVFAALKVILVMALKGGYNERQMTIVRGLASELGFIIYEFNGEYILVNGSNASGHAGTVIINDLANSLYLRYAYFKLKAAVIKESLYGAIDYVYIPLEQFDFSAHVSLVTYGDDNAMSVHESIPWFNHTSIAACLIQDGVTYTMADKEADSKPYINFYDVSFLKRTFKWSHDLQNYAGPLDEDSIFKSLHVVVASRVISAEQQAAEVINNANREYFYYGETIHTKRREQLTKIVELHNLQSAMSVYPLPTYKEMLVDYTLKYRS